MTRGASPVAPGSLWQSAEIVDVNLVDLVVLRGSCVAPRCVPARVVQLGGAFGGHVQPAVRRIHRGVDDRESPLGRSTDRMFPANSQLPRTSISVIGRLFWGTYPLRSSTPDG